jgi:hypothetical protein
MVKDGMAFFVGEGAPVREGRPYLQGPGEVTGLLRPVRVLIE